MPLGSPLSTHPVCCGARVCTRPRFVVTFGFTLWPPSDHAHFPSPLRFARRDRGRVRAHRVVRGNGKRHVDRKVRHGDGQRIARTGHGSARQHQRSRRPRPHFGRQHGVDVGDHGERLPVPVLQDVARRSVRRRVQGLRGQGQGSPRVPELPALAAPERDARRRSGDVRGGARQVLAGARRPLRDAEALGVHAERGARCSIRSRPRPA